MHTSAKHAFTLALGAAALAGVTQAQAFTAFQSEGPQSDELIIKGRVAYEYDRNAGGSDKNEHDDGGTRTNIKYTHNFNDKLSVLASTEWGYDPFFRHARENRKNGNDVGHFKRHQFVGVSYKGWGTLTAGKQDTVLAMVTDATDQYWVFGAEANGRGTALDGTDRAGRSLRYKNTFGDFALGAMYGGHDSQDNITRNHFAQVAGTWQATPEVLLGLGYNNSQMKTTGSDAHDYSIDNWIASAQWKPGNWTVAGLVSQAHNSKAYAHSRGYETYVKYDLKNLVELGTVQVYGGLNRLEDRDSSARTSSYLLGTALVGKKGVFGANDNYVVALEQAFNDSKGKDGQNVEKDHNRTSLLLRYNY